ncbi:CVNH domain-containing protein [Sarocladium strictum]
MSNFHESAADITVEDGHILKAVLNNIEGEGCEAEFDLSDCIGNEDGEFVWGGAGFADSAEEISFDIEEDQPILRAKLYNGDGELVDGVINLTERIGNNDGEFVFDG